MLKLSEIIDIGERRHLRQKKLWNRIKFGSTSLPDFLCCKWANQPSESSEAYQDEGWGILILSLQQNVQLTHQLLSMFS